MIESDGWHLVVTKGSHRQYKHPAKSGRVTIAGEMGEMGTLPNKESKMGEVKRNPSFNMVLSDGFHPSYISENRLPVS